MRSKPVIVLLLLLAGGTAWAQDPTVLLLKPGRVFDGEQMHAGWVVAVSGHIISYAGPAEGFAAENAGETWDLGRLT